MYDFDSGREALLCHVDGLGRFGAHVAEVVGPERARALVGKEVLRDGGRAVLEVLEEEGDGVSAILYSLW